MAPPAEAIWLVWILGQGGADQQRYQKSARAKSNRD
jgi:hypothetical protein